MCLEELKILEYKRKEDDWCFERYKIVQRLYYEGYTDIMRV